MCINPVTHELIKLFKHQAANLPTEKSMELPADSLICRTGMPTMATPDSVNTSMYERRRVRTLPKADDEQHAAIVFIHPANLFRPDNVRKPAPCPMVKATPHVNGISEAAQATWCEKRVVS